MDSQSTGYSTLFSAHAREEQGIFFGRKLNNDELININLDVKVIPA
jgi:hypothetical protein